MLLPALGGAAVRPQLTSLLSDSVDAESIGSLVFQGTAHTLLQVGAEGWARLDNL
jgi:hypothetical protein